MRGDWSKAQEYERKYWETHLGDLRQPPRDLPFVMSESLERRRVLEVGCGPMGTIFYCPGSLRAGLDPLTNVYAGLPGFDRRGVELVSGLGEQMPFAGSAFDALICGNVLDHVERPTAVLREMRRVLRDQGVLLLTLHVIPLWATPMRRLLLKIDAGHPHHLTKRDVVRELEAAGFTVRSVESTSPSLRWNSVKSIAANLAMANLQIRCSAGSSPQTPASAA